jgi:hypothetical protein
MAHMTLGVFSSTDQAEAAVRDLLSAGVDEANISYLYMSADDTVIEKNVDVEGSDVGEDVADGVSTGAGIGAIAGLALTALAVPGLGTLLAVGPLSALLGLGAGAAAGAVVGGVAGGLVGALTSLGVEENQAHVYEDRLRAGDILVAAESSDEVDIEGVFNDHGASEVNTYNVTT